MMIHLRLVDEHRFRNVATELVGSGLASASLGARRFLLLIVARLQQWHAADRIYQEIGSLDARELSDMSITRNDIPSVARHRFRDR